VKNKKQAEKKLFDIDFFKIKAKKIKTACTFIPSLGDCILYRIVNN